MEIAQRLSLPWRAILFPAMLHVQVEPWSQQSLQDDFNRQKNMDVMNLFLFRFAVGINSHALPSNGGEKLPNLYPNCLHLAGSTGYTLIFKKSCRWISVFEELIGQHWLGHFSVYRDHIRHTSSKNTMYGLDCSGWLLCPGFLPFCSDQVEKN